MVNRPVDFVVLIPLIILLSLPVMAADEAPANAEFLRLKTTYEKALQGINDSDLASTVSEQEKYLVAVKKMQKQMQEAGKLDPVLAIGRELDRFSASKKLEADDVSKDVPELVPIQHAYIKAVAKYPVEQARKMLALSQSYENALGALQESLTKKNDIRGAVEAKTEKESLANRADLMAARALVMEFESKPAPDKAAEKTPEKGAAKPVEAANAAVKPPTDAKAPVKKKYAGSPDKRIRQRFDDLVKSFLKKDFSKASDFADPEFVKTSGKDEVRRTFESVFPFLQLPDDPHRKFGVDSLKIDDDGQKGILVPKILIGGQWRDLPSNKWVEKEGDWYIDISDVDKSDRREAKHEAKQLEKAAEQQGRSIGPTRKGHIK